MRPVTKFSVNSLNAMATAVLTTFVVGALYLGRELLIPIALASLITFLLAPMVSRLERYIGRVLSVLTVVAVLFGVTGVGGYFFTQQLLELATRLPEHKENMQKKIRALSIPGGGRFTKLSQTFEELKGEVAGAGNAPAEEKVAVPKKGPTLDRTPSDPPEKPIPVEVVDSKRLGPAEKVGLLVAPIIGPLGTAALVLLLVICMLLQREDLRGRLIRLIGQGHISTTTRAMDDAASRVSRYLLMQLIVNVSYGIAVGVGLYFIGVPNSLLWGVSATVLRFIPYIGPWVAAAFPIILSLAVSTSWTMPLLVVGLFLLIELLSNNVMEPMLYGSSTGVTSIALILAAVFWTWLWGTAGLVLATPLTVCLVVMGQHVPKLGWLSVLLSDEAALAPAEECYHRLLTPDTNDALEFAEAFLKTGTPTVLYDTVFIPVVVMLERDTQTGELDEKQRSAAQEELRDLIDDLGSRPVAVSKEETEADTRPAPTCRVVVLPARASHDEVAGQMLTQLLTAQSYSAELVRSRLTSGEALAQIGSRGVDAVCISVVPPSNIVHARYLCSKLRAAFPKMRVLVGVWGPAEESVETSARLRAAGADEVVTSLSEAVASLGKYAAVLAQESVMLAPSCTDEEERLAALVSLHLLDTPVEASFDQITAKLTRMLEVPIALVSLVDRHRQFFKSQVGLSADLARRREVPRNVSVCTYVAATDELLVVEDLARNPRFANNEFLKEHGLRFYAGAPLRLPSGHVIGSLCVMDTKPRTFSERERKLLQVMAEEVMDLIARRATTTPVITAPPEKDEPVAAAELA